LEIPSRLYSRFFFLVLVYFRYWRYRVETFCQWTHEAASPTGFWIQVFKQDFPSQKKFEERVDTICQKLRSGDITYSDANYLWQQEVLEAQKRLGPETVKEMGKSLKEPMKDLLDLFTDMVKCF
jgi:hypothetical protein